LAPIKHKSEHKKTAAHADNQIPIMQSLHWLWVLCPIKFCWLMLSQLNEMMVWIQNKIKTIKTIHIILSTFWWTTKFGTATGYSLDGRGVKYWVLVGARLFSSHRPASYPMGTGVSFPGGKTATAISWPLTSKCWDQECMDLCIHSPSHLHDEVLNLRTVASLPFMNRDILCECMCTENSSILRGNWLSFPNTVM
jgi:hypothetical protein